MFCLAEEYVIKSAANELTTLWKQQRFQTALTTILNFIEILNIYYCIQKCVIIDSYRMGTVF